MKFESQEMIKSFLKRRLDKMSMVQLKNRVIRSTNRALRVYTYIIHENGWNDRGPEVKNTCRQIISTIHEYFSKKVVKCLRDHEMDRFKREKDKYKTRNKSK